jgi:hypothetical protein
MRLSIMQPYFFPYIGYFALIKNVDRFILLDEVQYIRHGWIERNRIINPKGEFTYIQVPLIKEEGRNTIIKRLRIRNDEEWQRKILSQLEVYRKRSPHYYAVRNLIADCISGDDSSIVGLNYRTLRAVCDYLEISTTIEIFSEMNLSIQQPNHPGEWALNICKAIGNVEEYWNPIGGKEIFNKGSFETSGIHLGFLEMNKNQYQQGELVFQENLSIIDLLMFNSKDEVKTMINNFTISD